MVKLDLARVLCGQVSTDADADADADGLARCRCRSCCRAVEARIQRVRVQLEVVGGPPRRLSNRPRSRVADVACVPAALLVAQTYVLFGAEDRGGSQSAHAMNRWSRETSVLGRTPRRRWYGVRAAVRDAKPVCLRREQPKTGD